MTRRSNETSAVRQALGCIGGVAIVGLLGCGAASAPMAVAPTPRDTEVPADEPAARRYEPVSEGASCRFEGLMSDSTLRTGIGGAPFAMLVGANAEVVFAPRARGR
jgi:hypothetical protein